MTFKILKILVIASVVLIFGIAVPLGVFSVGFVQLLIYSILGFAMAGLVYRKWFRNDEIYTSRDNLFISLTDNGVDEDTATDMIQKMSDKEVDDMLDFILTKAHQDPATE